MGYLSISNLYKFQDILEFKRVYAMEKVHGTSAHVSFKNGKVHFFSGGEKYDNFVKLFDQEKLLEIFKSFNQEEIVVFGEAYGGKQQGMSATYGKELRFIAFDVKMGNLWLDVPKADKVALKLGLAFVPYELVSTDISALDFERDRPSRVAKLCGIQEDRPAEGIVIRPIMEVRLNNGERMIAKHKRPDFSERGSKADTKVVDPDKLKVLSNAQEIADEWVTPMRLSHILGKVDKTFSMEDMPFVLRAMAEDILKESKGEIIDSKEARKAISANTSKLFTQHLKNSLF
jgi:hypothetical protein